MREGPAFRLLLLLSWLAPARRLPSDAMHDQTAMTNHSILSLAANPSLALDREAREIQVEFEHSRWRDRFELVIRSASIAASAGCTGTCLTASAFVVFSRSSHASRRRWRMQQYAPCLPIDARNERYETGILSRSGGSWPSRELKWNHSALEIYFGHEARCAVVLNAGEVDLSVPSRQRPVLFRMSCLDQLHGPESVTPNVAMRVEYVISSAAELAIPIPSTGPLAEGRCHLSVHLY